MLVAGVDEAGRGPLAGPVVAAAVVLDPAFTIEGVADSKTLSAARRETLFENITQRAIAVGIGDASVDEIDRLNIYHATLLAMQRAVLALSVTPVRVLIDGNAAPALPYPVTTIVKGDRTEPAISAASIIAKVTRDRLMDELDRRYPQYGFAQHRGYPTAAHVAALERYGASPIHRLSFRPVANVCR
jgi:ribonuclease HII